MRGFCFAVFATVVLSACSAAKFNANKDVTLTKTVFGSESPATLPPGVPDETVEVKYVCSNQQSAQRTNFKKAVTENRPVALTLNGAPCSTDLAKIKTLVAQKKITSANVNALCPAALISAASIRQAALVVDGISQRVSGNQINLLFDVNVPVSTGPGAPTTEDECDQRASPLVIHLNSDVDHPRAIELSSPEDGVLFDLLGKRNDHQPVRISWFTNQEYGFLALPDSHGQVRGIDELFGDNTSGPDGKFAANGYAALAKYDLNHDGRIDARDAVYRSLRVWIDRDRNAISRPSELISLERAGIEHVDLDFKKFEESDPYGNSTQMKSVVGLVDGTYDLIFDLWFAVSL